MQILRKLLFISTFYASIISVLVLLTAIYLLVFRFKRFWLKMASGFVILGCSVFIWTSLIEPNLIITKTTKITISLEEPVKIALIADTHLGKVKKEGFLKRVINKINNLEGIDYILIAGDFTGDPKSSEIENIFAPLNKLNKPAYAVLGNQDVGHPGEDIKAELIRVLENNRVRIVDNQVVNLDEFTLVGLGSHWEKNDQLEILNKLTADDDIIVLAHNPDTTLKYTNKNADLTLSGHTHCGQVRIPFIYKYVIPTSGAFDGNLTQEENTQLFITCGLGETGLPLRLFNPPVIDVLEIN